MVRAAKNKAEKERGKVYVWGVQLHTEVRKGFSIKVMGKQSPETCDEERHAACFLGAEYSRY